MERFAFAVAGCARARVYFFFFFFHQSDPILIEDLQQVNCSQTTDKGLSVPGTSAPASFLPQCLKQAEPRLTKGLPLVAD